METEFCRGYDNMCHVIDNLLDKNKKNINFYFDTNKECYIITWETENE